jgi:hypothetical protein
MSAKFCAQCGTGLGPADKFCAICGAKVISNCPTCGQAWDGVVASEVKKSAPAAKKVQAEPISEVTITQTVVGNKPIYGPDFDKSKDCANCGSPGKKKSCDVCGTGA